MRDIRTKLPSPSEQGAFNLCPAIWWFRYIEGVRKKESAARMVSGSAASEAMSEFYLPKGIDPSPLAVYDRMMNDAMVGIIGGPYEEEWMNQMVMDRSALELFFNSNQPLEIGWKKVLDAQGRIEEEVNLVPDAVVLLEDDTIQPQEWKMVSGFEDIEYLKLTYDMGFQPISYAKMCEVKYEKVCKSCHMKFLIRPKLAKGKYKYVPPSFEAYTVEVEPWKKVMWESSVNFTNAGMEYVRYLMDRPNARVEEIPRFTHNCIKKLGQYTYPCDFYAACSVNTHPLSLTNLFEGRNEKPTAVSKGSSDA